MNDQETLGYRCGSARVADAGLQYHRPTCAASETWMHDRSDQHCRQWLRYVGRTDMPKPKILVVDDNEDNLDLIADILPQDEFTLVRSLSGPDAMSLLMSGQFDLVLLDIMMPDMSGFAVLEMVRFIPRLMNTPVVVQTAHADSHNVERAHELGAKAVLTKPITPTKLIEEVRRLLPCAARDAELRVRRRLEGTAHVT